MLLAILPLLLCQSQIGPLWTDVQDPSLPARFMVDVTSDAQGNAIALGEEQTPSMVGGDIFRAVVRKLSPSGNLFWERLIPSDPADGAFSPKAIAVGAGGHVFVAGSLANNQEARLVCFAPNGDSLWTHVVQATGFNTVVAGGVAVSEQGQVLFSVYEYSSGVSLTWTRIISLDASGPVLWESVISSVISVRQGDMTFDVPRNRIYCFGDRIVPSGALPTVTALNLSGTSQWTHVSNEAGQGDPGIEQAEAVEVTPSGGVIMLSTYNHSSTNADGSRAVLERLDPVTGGQVWARTWLGSNFTGANGNDLDIDASGRLVICGNYSVSTSGDGAYVRRYADTGIFLDGANYLGPYLFGARFAEVLSVESNQVVVAGVHRSLVTFPGSPKSSPFVATYSAPGGAGQLTSMVSIGSFDAPWVFGDLQGMALAPDGDVYVATQLTPSGPAEREMQLSRFGDGPLYVCSTQQSSAGCFPAIQAAGSASASQPAGFQIAASAMGPNQFALFVYGRDGGQATPFGGGSLCIGSSGIRRMPLQTTGGTSGVACSGSISTDFNTWISGGNDPALSVGTQVWVQAWSRDPGAPSGSNLTGTLTFVVQP